MAVQKKDPAKPGYMSTEFWGLVVYGLHAFGGSLGLSPDGVDSAVSSFSGVLDKLGDNPLASVAFGAALVVYTVVRGWIKKTEIISNARLERIKLIKKQIERNGNE